MYFDKTAQIIYVAGGIAAAAVFPGGEAVVYSQNGVYGIAGKAVAYVRMMDLGFQGQRYQGPRTFDNLTIVAST